MFTVAFCCSFSPTTEQPHNTTACQPQSVAPEAKLDRYGEESRATRVASVIGYKVLGEGSPGHSTIGLYFEVSNRIILLRLRFSVRIFCAKNDGYFYWYGTLDWYGSDHVCHTTYGATAHNAHLLINISSDNTVQVDRLDCQTCAFRSQPWASCPQTCHCHQAVKLGASQGVVMPCGWE